MADHNVNNLSEWQVYIHPDANGLTRVAFTKEKAGDELAFAEVTFLFINNTSRPSIQAFWTDHIAANQIGGLANRKKFGLLLLQMNTT